VPAFEKHVKPAQDIQELAGIKGRPLTSIVNSASISPGNKIIFSAHQREDCDSRSKNLSTASHSQHQIVGATVPLSNCSPKPGGNRAKGQFCTHP
jgi:hypothetical protein